jgi:hypothetical protein
MTLSEAKLKAQTESALHGCVQHVNFKFSFTVGEDMMGGEYYVSDWYNSDSTVKSYSNGNERY